MVEKIICLILCAVLIFVCYRTKFVAEKVFRRADPAEDFLLRIKGITFIAAATLFIAVIILL